MALDGTTLYIGGTFTMVGVTARNGLAAINAQTGSLLSWDPGATGGAVEVRRIIPKGSTIYVFGDFTTAGGSARNRAAAIDASTGLATSWNPNIGGTVDDAIVDTPNAVVYMSGAFTTVNGGTGRNRIAAFDITSATVTGWNPNANGTVECMSLLGSNIYAGGAFTTIGGASRSKVAAVDTTTGLATAWDANVDTTVFSIIATAPTIWLGGNFTTVGGFPRTNAAAVNTFNAGVQPFDPAPDGSVLQMQLYSLSHIYMAGLFTTNGGSSRSKFADIDASFGTANTWVADSAGGGNSGRYILRTPYAVFVGGQFTSINGTSKTGIAATVP